VERPQRKIRAFNKARQLKVWFLAEGEWELKSGHWVEVSEELASVYLWREKDIILDWGLRPRSDRGYLSHPHLLFASAVDCLTGYGSTAMYLIPRLAERFNLHLFPLGSWPPGDWRKEALEASTVQLMDQADVAYCEWAVALTIPTELPRVPGQKVILYGMWETDELPAGWAELTNQFAHHLIVPCEAQAEVWEKSGVTIPISVVPLGVDTNVWAYEERPARAEDAPFTVLLFGLLSSRKSPLETLSAVCWRALAQEEDWLLILKSWAGNLGGGQFTPIIADPRVKIVMASYSPKEMVELCRQADLGIFLSKYEGFGLPPREMMATGLPVIWSAHSGHLSDCYRGVTIDVPIKHIIPSQHPYTGLGGWGEPDWQVAADALRREYDDWHTRGKTQSPLGTKAAQYIRERRTWAHTADGIARVIEGLM